MMIAGTEHRRQGCSLQDGKQWGENVGGGGQTVSLPISFEVAFTAVVSADSSWCNASCHITTTTITTMNYQSNKPDIAQLGPVQWLAIGIQPQWGYYVESQNPTDYRYWSIPFTSHYITMATKTYYEPKEEAVPWLVGIDMQKFICGYGANFIGSSYVSCVGIGCQPQWGYQKQLTVEPVVYPLPVNTVCCVWAHSIHDRQDPGTYHSILSKITPVGVQILAGQYNAPATAYSGISAYWGMIGW